MKFRGLRQLWDNFCITPFSREGRRLPWWRWNGCIRYLKWLQQRAILHHINLLCILQVEILKEADFCSMCAYISISTTTNVPAQKQTVEWGLSIKKIYLLKKFYKRVTPAQGFYESLFFFTAFCVSATRFLLLVFFYCFFIDFSLVFY